MEELTQKLVITVASGILGYTRMRELLKHHPKATYIPPTKEEVIREYQNVPIFNRTVDAIVSSLRATLQPIIEMNGICYCDMDKAIEWEVCKKCGGAVLPAA